MSVLALKALSYGAEQIPDKFFEKIPGGFFTPQESRDIKQGRKDRKDRKGERDRERRRSEDRSERRPSRREGTLSTHLSYDSANDDSSDSDNRRQRERRKKEGKRAKSAGRSPSISSSRARDDRRSSGLDGEYSDSRNMAQPEQGVPYFPPPPTSEYKPYNPQDHSYPPVQNGHRSSSAIPAYGYSSKVNSHFSDFRNRCSALPSTPEHPTPVNSCPPLQMNRPPLGASTLPFFPPPLLHNLSSGTPVSAAFSPSYEPPLAALLQSPPTNSSKSAAARAYPAQPSSAQHEASRSAASRYTPGPGYAPSSPMNFAHRPPTADANESSYSPYTLSDYPPGMTGYAGSTYSLPPPFQRHRSSSQPAHAPGGNLPYPTYVPPSADQQVMTAYDQPPSRRSSTKPDREYRHRAMSADSRSRSSKEYRRESSRMGKVRERLDGMDLHEKGLAATVGGAAAGAIGGRAIADKRSKSRGEQRTQSRTRSRSRARDHDRERGKDIGLHARSRSVTDRFRSKSRGPDDRDSRASRRDRRPDRGYEDGDEYEYFSSESEGDGSPVQTRRRRRRRRRED
ncbi:hypothetical protein LEMA_P040270.1 [Plenodomus lingam JN3]|uniref:Uncharacterized protein n=1 Tax=Leptosphaeria maculans (strain JN3 / isolate v23.1.3 / race Av1-4-5-6-7-8) TaxID=985895 RepID=E4ZPA1_LEPMJ|nr:hypothetical protein LEMA_P040270.1 [Plenodomus lingam JN3]CBX93126.1 hypothetical protein LEMA_P040270.1 [Plenodomus lingam JN3]